MERPILHADLEAYLGDLHGDSPDIVAEMEAVARERDFPIVGPLVGRLLTVLARSIGAKSVCELGSGFGYSTMFFAEAVGPSGHVIHTELSRDKSDEARTYLERAGLADRVEHFVGDALDVFGTHPGPFDIVFCDVDKEYYPRVPDLAVPRLRTGGLLIFDNTLWYGRVADRDPDPVTAAVQTLNAELFARAELLTTIVPIRDGVSVSLKL